MLADIDALDASKVTVYTILVLVLGWIARWAAPAVWTFMKDELRSWIKNDHDEIREDIQDLKQEISRGNDEIRKYGKVVEDGKCRYKNEGRTTDIDPGGEKG